MYLITRSKPCRWSVVVGTVHLSCLIVLIACGTGCKSGTSMGTSWGSFGMGGPDPATLAEAPVDREVDQSDVLPTHKSLPLSTYLFVLIPMTTFRFSS